ncbi:E3 ubiquitin-protein ligase sina-like isoform X2 [Zootermopsis nevadensis]|uniref:E3 ubiquitin-protein ligase sina-like isoform X2 n=1 Tax=Zootermopsis nevadensis TaxID=136037 RepID=UPI000B8E4EAE|nr:E3 ubiquitin-protein ligase sina-like isoform X2 [Zootermopsis nevadensis]
MTLIEDWIGEKIQMHCQLHTSFHLAMDMTYERKTMEDIVAELHNAWLEFMVCSLCKKYILPPVIEICTNGHNGCETCVTQLTVCPICKLPADKYQNTGIEEACRSANIRVPCNNRSWGCSERSLIDDMRNHSIVCVHQQIPCPFASSDSPCSWCGPISGLQRHMIEKHHDCRVVITQEEPIHLSYSCETQKLVVIRGIEIFLILTLLREPCVSKYYCTTVKYVGPKHNADKYIYEVNIAGGYKHEIQDDIRDPEMVTESGGHIHVFNTTSNVTVPVRECKYYITISRHSQSSVSDDDSDSENASDYESS